MHNNTQINYVNPYSVYETLQNSYCTGLLLNGSDLIMNVHSHSSHGAMGRGDYMIGQKSSIAINLLNLVGHPYIALEI